MFSSSRVRSDINAKLLAKFPGIIASIDILNGATAHLGPPIDDVSLIFERTSVQARRDRAGLYRLFYDPSINPLNPPAPARLRGAYQATRGNVVVLWDYPDTHPVLSKRLVANCTPEG